MKVIFHAHYNHAKQILYLYDGQIPLHHFLKKYFSQHAQCGSKDRKSITQIVYAHYRIGHCFSPLLPLEQQTQIAFSVLEFVNVEKQKNTNLKDILLGIETLIPDFSFLSHFTFQTFLSAQIQILNYAISFLQSPCFYIKIRKQDKDVKTLLEQKKVSFRVIKNDVLQILDTKPIETILTSQKENYVIQDYSCQQLLDHIVLKGDEKIWDCCCGSGGKTILLKDAYPNLSVFNSDVRKSVLANLQERLKRYGLKTEQIFQHDAENKTLNKNFPVMDIILADVPCTGSGTWQSTPEQKFFFHEAQIEAFTQKQKKIVANVLPTLKNDGFLIYITCSVFVAENEHQVAYFAQHHQLEIIHQEYINADKKFVADTIFIAICKKITA